MGQRETARRSANGRSTLPELLRRNPQRAIEFRRRVFPRHDFRQLDDGVVVEVLAHAREELVGDFAAGDGHGVGEFEDEALDVVEEWRRFPIGQRQQLLVRDAECAADRSVDVLSELAAVEEGDAPIDHRHQPRIDQSRGIEAAPHHARAFEIDGRRA